MKNNFNFLNPFANSGIEGFVIDDYRNEIRNSYKIQSNKKLDYQVVILGAGKGSRMGISYPKVLYELNYPDGKKSILENTLENIRKLKECISIKDIYLAIDKKTTSHFSSKEFRSDINILELNSSDIKGTAVSINAIRQKINSDFHTIFLWGDLALWRVSDLNLVLNFQSINNSFLAFPTRIKIDPYVAFLRSKNGKLSRIIHSNEEQGYLGLAEQDCLSFSCAPGALDHLEEFLSNKINLSKEVDFIHYILFLAKKGFMVAPIPISIDGTVYGLNTPKRAKEINEKLCKLSAQSYCNFFRNIN